MVRVAWAEVAPQLRVRQRLAGGLRERLGAAQRRFRRAADDAGSASPRNVLRHAGLSWVEARICGQVHGLGAGAPPGQAAADVHQAGRVAGGADVGAGAQHVARSCRPASPTRCRRSSARRCRRTRSTRRACGSSTRSMPVDRAQQRQRLVADPQHPQRVAGRVVGDPVRVVGADVGDPEHIDQQLGQLVGPARPARWPAAASAVSPTAAGDHRVLVPDRADARAGRRDRDVERRGLGTPRRGAAPPAAPPCW